MPEEELCVDEVMDDSATLNLLDQDFVFKARGGKYKKSSAEGVGGWPLAATKGP